MTDLCLDGRMAEMSGIGTYLRGLTSGLRDIKDNSLSLALLQRPGASALGPWPRQDAASAIYSLGEQLEIPRLFRKSGGKVLHAPHYNLPVACASRCVVTVHDLIHLLFPEFLPSLAARAYAHFFFRMALPRARLILTVSKHTQHDLSRHLGIPHEKIRVIPLGVDDAFHPQEADALAAFRQRYQLPDHYLLYVGNLKPFKNVQRLLAAHQAQFRSASGSLPLVMVGRNFIPGFDEELKKAAGLHYLPGLAHADLPSAYAGASALLFPSLYEGFGLPPLEAMACGTAVLSSGRASLPEVVGDAALTVDPEDIQSISEGIRRIVADDSLRQSLSEAGRRRAGSFRWSKTAEMTLAAYREALA